MMITRDGRLPVVLGDDHHGHPISKPENLGNAITFEFQVDGI
jgi:hypothetical protein